MFFDIQNAHSKNDFKCEFTQDYNKTISPPQESESFNCIYTDNLTNTPNSSGKTSAANTFHKDNINLMSNNFNGVFKIPSHDNYMELCQLLMDKEERQEYINPLVETGLFKNSPKTTETHSNIVKSKSSPEQSTLQTNSYYETTSAYNPKNSYYNSNCNNTYNSAPFSKQKPEDSYAYMILKALSSSKDGMLTLNEIYTWIEMNYSYFRTADVIWKNSIRHNLSLNAAFKKNPRNAMQKGKGGYWSIVDDKEIVRKINRKRRVTRSYTHMENYSNFSSNLNGNMDCNSNMKDNVFSKF